MSYYKYLRQLIFRLSALQKIVIVECRRNIYRRNIDRFWSDVENRSDQIIDQVNFFFGFCCCHPEQIKFKTHSKRCLVFPTWLMILKQMFFIFELTVLTPLTEKCLYSAGQMLKVTNFIQILKTVLSNVFSLFTKNISIWLSQKLYIFRNLEVTQILRESSTQTWAQINNVLWRARHKFGQRGWGPY